jgi:hypothetical protein
MLLSGFVTGCLSFIYLFISYRNLPEIIWGEINTVSGFFATLLRQGYGTFVPGQFISDIPIHRVVQLFNMVVFIYSDFTLF